LVYRNYTPGTFLTGWDTLHPEFDFKLNFQRLFFGVWRADQGLGAISGHSAMADLPRVFILWLFHFILPLSLLRYSYVFLCLIVGPLAFYYLIRQLLPRHPGVALISSLVYLFNFGTLQQFYVPFEMFPTQWALLPLLILVTIRCLQHPSRRHLLVFFLVNLLATPQAYAAHLWYPFFGLMAIFFFLWSKTNRRPFKYPLILILLTLAANSFWLLPNLYFAASNSLTPQLHKANRLHSQEFLERNRETGTLAQTSLIKGFYFNWDSFDFTNNRPDKLMPQWSRHSSLFDVKLIGNLIFLGAFIGLISVLLRGHPLFLPLSPFFIIPFVLLANNVPLFRNIFDYLLTLPLLSEVFRFIFTKMSILYTFGLSLFFAYFTYLLFLVKPSPNFKKRFGIIMSVSLLIYCFPFFQGQLISPLVRQSIPAQYLKLYQATRHLPPGIALTLPLHQSSGWQYYDWNYQGSGFIWFGLPFGTLDRDSDRWAQTNEEAYREFYYSLYSSNPSQFLLNLKKYNISYLLWDSSNIATTSKNQTQVTLAPEIETLLLSLASQNQITSVFNSGSLHLYQLNPTPSQVIVQNLKTNVSPTYSRHYQDSAFTGTNYFTKNEPTSDYYPFRNILSHTDRLNLQQFRITNSDSIWKLTNLATNSQIQLEPYRLYNNSALSGLITNPLIKASSNYITFSSFNTTNGVEIKLPQMDHSQSFIIGVKSKYVKGIPLRLCLYNYSSNLCSFEDELTKNSQFGWDYFLVPPMDSFAGYNLNLNAISYNFRSSLSLVSDIQIFKLDYSLLNTPSSFASQPPEPPIPQEYQLIWPNNSLVKINNPNFKSHLLFFQSYSPDWLAFYFNGATPVFLNNHVLINNWANGWELPPQLSHQRTNGLNIYILFWPQLLQFLGFILIPLTFLLIRKTRFDN